MYQSQRARQNKIDKKKIKNELSIRSERLPIVLRWTNAIITYNKISKKKNKDLVIDFNIYKLN